MAQVVHLKRFHYDGHYRDKIETKIDFPLENLDLTPYILDKRRLDQSPPIYDLYAVSNHSGSLHGGHYTAYAHNPYEGKWYNFDDSWTNEVPSSDVVSEAAYVLFYRRRDVVTQPLPDDSSMDISTTDDETKEESTSPTTGFLDDEPGDANDPSSLAPVDSSGTFAYMEMDALDEGPFSSHL